MGWKDFLFGASEKTAPKTLTRLRWQTACPGDEQWCGTAKAMYTPLDFTIESFGEYSAPPLALELIRDASKSFPKAVIWISLDSSTEVVVRTLNENSMIVSTEIELNPGSRVAKVISISETD